MEFKLRLTPGTDFSEVRTEYDPALDNIMSIFDQVCCALNESKTAEFSVSGFGQDRWPIEVRVELSLLLEQLADAIASAQANDLFEIDFYEQGVERTIRFEPKGKLYSAQCSSRTKWVPNPMEEIIEAATLLRMLCKIRDDFMSYLQSEAPHIANHPWLVNYFGNAVASASAFPNGFWERGEAIL